MPAIHHATVKRAATLGFEIEGEDEFTVTGHGLDLNFPEGVSAKDALDLANRAKITQAEYQLVLSNSDEGFEARSSGKTGRLLAQGEDLAEVIADAIDVLSGNVEAPESDEDGDEDEQVDADADAEAEEEEPTDTGSVVKEKYRQAYAQAGDPDSCGDNLAILLKALKSPDGIDVERLEKLADANGIGHARYDRGGRGWEGRMRMSIGNVLRGRIRREEPVDLSI